ncbi:hypothetical protein NMG60_11016978 [Bertholletia excelsa]
MENKGKKSRYPCLRLTTLLALLILVQELSSNSGFVGAENGHCNGSIEVCNENGEEMAMESEISQRLLSSVKFITVGALKPNLPACGRGGRGVPFSGSCLPSASNPENRGCSHYYRCRK